jgi:hypothetical protein
MAGRLSPKEDPAPLCEEGLWVPRSAAGGSAASADRLRAEPDHELALDYQFDVTAAGG